MEDFNDTQINTENKIWRYARIIIYIIFLLIAIILSSTGILMMFEAESLTDFSKLGSSFYLNIGYTLLSGIMVFYSIKNYFIKRKFIQSFVLIFLAILGFFLYEAIGILTSTHID